MENPMKRIGGGGEMLHCGEMSKNSRDQRERRDLVVALPPSSASAASTVTTFESLTPRSLLSRWLNSRQKPPMGGGGGRRGGGGGGVGCRVRFPRYRSKKRREEHEEEEEEEDDDEGELMGPPLVDLVAPGETGGAGEAPCSASASIGSRVRELSASSGKKPEELSLNFGMGVGLVFLLLKSSNEFNKMIELQEHIAVLLKDVKKEIRRKEKTSSFVDSNSNIVLFESNCCMTENSSNPILLQNHGVSYNLVGAHAAMDSVSHSKSDTIKKKSCTKLNQLESELEVELERLQLNMEGEDSSVVSQQNRTEFTGENFDPPESHSVNFVEAYEPKEADSYTHCGVCPRELERRLHELLESRQLERIMELEFALECAERKLREKEVEVCWWRDTAKLVSKHRDETLFR